MKLLKPRRITKAIWKKQSNQLTMAIKRLTNTMSTSETPLYYFLKFLFNWLTFPWSLQIKTVPPKLD